VSHADCCHVLSGCVCCSAANDNIQQNVTIVLVHDVILRGNSSSSSSTNKTRSVSLQLRHLLVTPPLGHTLSQLRSLVLPLHGPVLVGPGDGVVELPYVGDVSLVSLADTNYANIQEVPGGFLIRGLVSVVLRVHTRGRSCHSKSPTTEQWGTGLRHVQGLLQTFHAKRVSRPGASWQMSPLVPDQANNRTL
jgi:hypothetical protein